MESCSWNGCIKTASFFPMHQLVEQNYDKTVQPLVTNEGHAIRATIRAPARWPFSSPPSKCPVPSYIELPTDRQCTAREGWYGLNPVNLNQYSMYYRPLRLYQVLYPFYMGNWCNHVIMRLVLERNGVGVGMWGGYSATRSTANKEVDPVLSYHHWKCTCYVTLPHLCQV